MTATNAAMTADQDWVPLATSDAESLAPDFYTVDAEVIRVRAAQHAPTTNPAEHADPDGLFVERGIAGTVAAHNSGSTLTAYNPDAPGPGGSGIPQGVGLTDEITKSIVLADSMEDDPTPWAAIDDAGEISGGAGGAVNFTADGDGQGAFREVTGPFVAGRHYVAFCEVDGTSAGAYPASITFGPSLLVGAEAGVANIGGELPPLTIGGHWVPEADEATAVVGVVVDDTRAFEIRRVTVVDLGEFVSAVPFVVLSSVMIDGSLYLTSDVKSQGFQSLLGGIQVRHSGSTLKITGLPTSDPEVAGVLYTAGAPAPGAPVALMVSGGPA